MPSYSGIFTLQAQMQAIAAGTWPSPPPSTIGQAYGGGYYAGQIGVGGVATHYLVVGPAASAQTSGKQWKTSNTTTAGTSSAIDGPANSAAMNDATHPAAFFCEGLSIGGYSDWYMPAKNELEVCYYNLKPSAVSNVTNSGINPNAVPARASNYTAGNPTQTSATAFRSAGAETFIGGGQYYWNSTEASSANAWLQTFNEGYQVASTKTSSVYVRAIRRVAV